MIEQNSIENLKNHLDIVDVVSSYIEVKKAGANYKAICPFHSEKTPSFVISPTKQICHCFSCGAGGDAIKFVMLYEHLSYPEAIEKLANLYNFSLSYTQSSGKSEDNKILDKTNLFFQQYLEKNHVAKEYLDARGVYNSFVEKFEIGYAPSSSEFMQFMQKNFISMQEALKVGIVAQGESGYYARFTNRIIFPIFSPSDRLVGFGGRTISNHPAKYINSPQSVVFNKSKLLYGYSKAKPSIIKKKQIIVTEGYLDVIMLHQVGFDNAVATLGTALTSEHIPLLKKTDPQIIISYDGDKAGIAAAIKAAQMLSMSLCKGGVVLFPSGFDPADMVKDHKIAELKEIFAKPKPFIEFYLQMSLKQKDLTNAHEKNEALKQSIEFIRGLPVVVQEEYRRFVASLLQIDERLIKLSSNTQGQKKTRQKEDIAELSLIKTLLMQRSLIDMVLDSCDMGMFVTHAQEFQDLISEIDSKALIELELREDIKIYDEEALIAQLCIFLSNHYTQELKRVAIDKQQDFETKNYKIRKIQQKLAQLRVGKLVAAT
jgi:DNA primase